jgi:hypothetical protein
MGEFLSAPIKDKVSEDVEGNTVKIFLTILVEICKLWNARLEKKNGRLPYQ